MHTRIEGGKFLFHPHNTEGIECFRFRASDLEENE